MTQALTIKGFARRCIEDASQRRFDRAHKRALSREKIYQEWHEKRTRKLFESEFFGA